MNDELMKPFVAEDVKKALFSIGLHAVFSKKCWNILGDVLTEEVLQAINTK
jgi:hypothetical protein